MHQTSPLLDSSTSGEIRRGNRAYRITTALTVFAMLFGGILLLTVPTVTAQGGGAATTSSVNLRTEPSADSDVITVLDAGTALEITGDPENGFYPVTADGNWGYVSAEYVGWDGAAADTGGSQGDVPSNSGNAGATRYITNGALNLRSGPTTSDGIITVMPDGAALQLTGEESNGFAGVTYNGQTGWAFAECLSATDPNGGDGSGSVPDEAVPDESVPDEAIPDEAVPDETVPDEGVPSGNDPVQVGDTVVGSGFVIDGALNLRSGPSTANDVLTVMPDGASLEIMGDVQSGFYPVRYNGQTGWAYAEFVSVGGTTPEAPVEQPGDTGEQADDGVAVPGNDSIGSAMVIDGALNLRSGPGTTYNIVTVMPDSAEVSLLGDPQNGFYPVSFNGQTGWAFADYLSTGGDAAPAPGTVPTPDPGTIPTPAPGTDPAPDPGTDPGTEPDPGTDAGNGDTDGDGSWTRDELVAIINTAAAEYGQPAEDMIRVAACESVWDPYAVNSSSGASGLFQFMPGTWLTTPFADQDIFDPVANANAAAWMWANGRRNEWSCQ